MALPVVNFLLALLGIVFVLGCAFTALASLIYARSDHGFQRRLDIAFVLLAGFIAWGWLPSIRQSFDRVTDPHLQSSSVDGLAFLALALWTLLSLGFLLISLRRAGAALRLLQRR